MEINLGRRLFWNCELSRYVKGQKEIKTLNFILKIYRNLYKLQNDPQWTIHLMDHPVFMIY